MNTKPTPVCLYLRTDGTLLLSRQDANGESRSVEIALTPPQLLQLGTDALRLAVALRPGMLEDAMQAMANTLIVDDAGGAACHTH